MQYEKKMAFRFCKEHKVRLMSSATLTRCIAELGYKIVRYNSISNTQSVSKLLTALRLDDYAKLSKAFTYVDANMRIVFLYEGLSERENVILLSHEIGHIYLNNTVTKGVFGDDIKSEHDANEFAHYLLKAPSHKKYIRIGTTFAVCAILALSGIVGYSYSNFHEQYYYVTSSGTKYHTADCEFVRGKDNVKKLTADQLKKEGFEPCKICNPDSDK